MPAHRFGIVVVTAALCAIFASVGGCSSDTTTGTTGTGGAAATTSSSTTASAGGEMASSSTGATSGSTSSSGSTTGSAASSSSTGGGGPGHCKKGCVQALDCCPPGSMGCPGNSYPNNFTCDNGACGSPQCSVKADCTFGGQLPQYDCTVINGFHACIEPCATDADCGSPSKCLGVDDGMKKYCKIDMGPECTVAADCAGIGQCVMGSCVCTGDADCTDPTANVCAK